jgi:hypothetical protein
MPHNAEDVMGEVDWEEWPDFDLFADADGEDVTSASDEAAV